jgi:formylmethanofuran dehydrogenase subunit E
MSIYEIGNGRFAIGKFGERALYVVKASGKKVTGVRGQRPLLDKRYKKTTASTAVKAALKAALA